jgi:hypothetical protein
MKNEQENTSNEKESIELTFNSASTRVRQIELAGSTDYKRIQRLFNEFLLYNYTHLSFKPVIDYLRKEEAKVGITKYYLKLQKYAILKGIAETFLKQGNFKKIAEYRELFKIFKYNPRRKKDTPETLIEINEFTKCMVYASQEERMHLKGLWFSRLRNIEYRSIRLDKCNLKKKSLSVEVVGKGNHPRMVPFPLDVYEYALKKYKGKIYLFETPNGKPMSRISLQALIRSARKRVGLNFTARTLRKSGHNYLRERFPMVPIDQWCSEMGHTQAVEETHYNVQRKRTKKVYSTVNREINSKIKKVRSKRKNGRNSKAA